MWWTLLACWAPEPPPRPAEVPVDAVEVRWTAEQVEVHAAGATVGAVPLSAFAVDPVDAAEPTLVALLEGAPSVWITAADDTPWYLARKALGSAAAAGHPRPWLTGPWGTVRATEQPPIALKMRCAAGPLAWEGAQARVTVALQRNDEATWIRATAQALPLVDGRPTEGLPASCLEPVGCAALFDEPSARAACELGLAEGAPARVELGLEVGCLMPLRKGPDDDAAWRTAMPLAVGQLGLGRSGPVILTPEASIPWSLVTMTLVSFAEAGLPIPSLGGPLIEGNDGPPVCVADVRDAAGLETWRAKVVGGWLRSAQEGR
jgi:hypothetical protein